MVAFYNEIDPFAAEWLRQLIKAGHIAPGVVDTRSIVDVKPQDLLGYDQCHFFAGIGVWSYALRRAGWPDHRKIWTASCPCQPFSSAGAGGGFTDERHLWPHLHWLIEKCRPGLIVGEQVASQDGLAWFDLVQADLEGSDYTSAAVDFGSASVGAPHIRQRLYWMGYTEGFAGWTGLRDIRERGFGRDECADTSTTLRLADDDDDGFNPWVAGIKRTENGARCEHRNDDDRCSVDDGLGNNNNKGLEGLGGGYQTESRWFRTLRSIAETGKLEWVADDSSIRREMEILANGSGAATSRVGKADVRGIDSASDGMDDAFGDRWRTGGNGYHGKNDGQQPTSTGRNDWAGPTNGFWRDADWLFCRDGKWRPVEPGSQPLVNGLAKGMGYDGDISASLDKGTGEARIGRLKGYGNAINAEQATVFIETVEEILFDTIGNDY